MSKDSFGWGILGTGRIARLFAGDLALVPGARLAAVGSRDEQRAREAAGRWRAAAGHGSYEALVADPAVDVVYVATPHQHHKQACLLALAAGKPVLCEKPFTLNAIEAAELIAFARVKKLFLMEAMWTRFFPAMARLREWIGQGLIGEPRLLQASFGFRTRLDPEDRLFNPELAGGSLLDLGVYPVSLASMLFGPPRRVGAAANLGETGVDEQAGVVLEHAGGKLAVLASSLRSQLPQDAWIAGTSGRIRIHAPFWRSTALSLERMHDPDAGPAPEPDGWRASAKHHGRRLARLVGRLGTPGAHVEAALEGMGRRLLRGDELRVERFPEPGHGLHHEAAEVQRCLREGLTEHPLMPLDESLQIMRTLDRVRLDLGLRYPNE